MFDLSKMEQKSSVLWEIPKSFRPDMRVPARVYVSRTMLGQIGQDRSLGQLVNMATLPGIQKYALAMPDIHEGYGFPIGGVAAFDKEEGVISPGGIGYDINCGIRLLCANLTREEILPYLEKLGQALFNEIPSGVGQGGRFPMKGRDFDLVLEDGAERVKKLGYSREDDLLSLESGGRLEGAEAGLVSEKAKARGRDQLGTLGAGNHFVEVGYVEKIFDAAEAEKMRLAEDQITVLIHTGSRGLGHQVATDYIRVMVRSLARYGFSLPDRELACVPFSSAEGQDYFAAMKAAANFAWANRQLITYEVREAFAQIFSRADLALATVYDVAHNIAKLENYEISGKSQEVLVHRKGATRAFPGQPVIIPGSMGSASYVLVGQEESLAQSFGTTCHGAGRRLSRTQADKKIDVGALRQELAAKGIVVVAGTSRGLAEEAPLAYKDIDEVVGVIDEARIAKKIARLRPLAVIKG